MIQPHRAQLHALVSDWMKSWNEHDLNKVISLFADEAIFESWTGSKIQGKQKIKLAWSNWFIHHDDFHFEIEDLAIDEKTQDVVLTWKLNWLGQNKAPEIRHGIDFLHFENALITLKRSYSQPPQKNI